MKFNIGISGLVWACYVFPSLSKNDEAFLDFFNKTNNKVQLNKKGHIKELEKWLNKWGCRGFAGNFYNDITGWYKNNQRSLPSFGKTILGLTERQLQRINHAYNSLRKITSVGETSASKILFALRPNSILPWDQTIRKEFYRHYGKAKGGREYFNFLLKVKENVGELSKECKKHKTEIVDIPQKYGRRSVRYPLLKPIDEYYWITISKGCALPTKKTLECIYKWS